ncbi:2-hydroxy-palmitic acid dioxygenase MPO1 [Aspergillus foveolatus]|uniref:2-hydroxy-palmitic acid dioxygenase MPO1 n=1 Tax=Aspergillus foveolatus TaxID=210207 RepID=UPI003CCE1E1B
MALNLEKQLLFYGAYHNNPVNVAIHITCVPILLFTGIAMASNSPPLFKLPEVLQFEDLPPNIGTIAALVYATFYVLLEPVAGTLIAPLLLGAAALGNRLLATYGMTANCWFGGIHVVSWLLQFVGHGAFEGRAPALLDNLVQALLLAPLFVWMEILFFFGYRPELRARYEASVKKEIAAFKEKRNKALK